MRLSLVIAALALSGCATTYQLSVMPRDSGKMYSGTATQGGGSEGRISIEIEGKTYAGTWVQTAPDRSYGYVSGGAGYGYGWGPRWGGMATISVDNPSGSEAKALLSASDGSGLRCEFRSGYSTGGGVCRDDRGKEYDVQLRAVAPRG